MKRLFRVRKIVAEWDSLQKLGHRTKFLWNNFQPLDKLYIKVQYKTFQVFNPNDDFNSDKIFADAKDFFEVKTNNKASK